MNNFTQLIGSVAIALLVSSQYAQADTIGFDDLALEVETYFDPDTNAIFESGAATFSHFAPFGPCCWSGFTYSNKTDQTTPGFMNDTSAYQPPAGGGALATTNYGAVFDAGARFEFATPVAMSDAYLTNNTYAALSMRDGDAFAKKFGGASGDDPDFFAVNIIGLDALDRETGMVKFHLADYRFADNSTDYIVDAWTNIDLSPLGIVSAVTFSFESSDVGTFGINTPVYLAIDEISFLPVPLPAGIWLLLSGLAALFGYRRARQAI